jgi:hypothetical protein
MVCAMSCELPLVPSSTALAGTEAPLIFPTVVATPPAALVTSPVSAGI